MTNEVIALAETLARPFESCRLRFYWDPVKFDRWGRPAGFPTQGWGHLHVRTTKLDMMRARGLDINSRADHDMMDELALVQFPDWSQEQADETLAADMARTWQAVKRLVRVGISPTQAAALLDFGFNLGAGNLQASTLLRMVNRGEFADAAEQFGRWNKAGGVVLAGLTRRRAAEKRLFST